VSNFNVIISTPTIDFKQEQISRVQIQTESGVIEILPEHSQIISELEVSYLDLFDKDNNLIEYFINGGSMVFQNNTLLITSADSILINKEDNPMWLNNLKDKRTKLQNQINQALSYNSYNQKTDDLSFDYLIAEERLAKIELMRSLLK
jgi:F0F1-type ATP synthase epsilon subunit